MTFKDLKVQTRTNQKDNVIHTDKLGQYDKKGIFIFILNASLQTIRKSHCKINSARFHDKKKKKYCYRFDFTDLNLG